MAARDVVGLRRKESIKQSRCALVTEGPVSSIENISTTDSVTPEARLSDVIPHGLSRRRTLYPPRKPKESDDG